MKTSRALLIGILLAVASVATAAKPHYTLTGKVVAIADGDTLTVLDETKTQHKIRLAGIDAPEKGQAFGTKAREALGDKVFQQTVRVEVIDVDRYRREVGRIYLGDRFINMEMVRTVSPGDTSNTTSQGNSRPRKTMPASIDGDCGPTRIQRRRGNGGRRSGRRQKRVENRYQEAYHHRSLASLRGSTITSKVRQD